MLLKISEIIANPETPKALKFINVFSFIPPMATTGISTFFIICSKN